MTNTFEAGYRFNNRDLQMSLTGYYVKFTNRLLASSISATVVGNQNVLQNVGGRVFSRRGGGGELEVCGILVALRKLGI